ncbi:SMI1/KNR4 family protein [Undibacterium sp. TJN25]|uniref:SMI1/KNR4 family protein n=1 Tax=Undibacterium sp. TJN25 TaxID=3413056 RepID=UPI003BF2F62B
MYDAIENWEGIPGKPSLPVGDDGGGNQIYLAWDTDAPSVWICLHDENEARVKIANSFEEFIDKLFLDEGLLD